VSNTLTLSSASTAKGVGIQVLNGTTVISYGPAIGSCCPRHWSLARS